MEKHVFEEISKVLSEPNVSDVLVSDNKGLCIFSSEEVEPHVTGHLTYITKHISKLNKKEPYPTIILKSDKKSCLIKGSENSCISIFYQNKQ